MSKDDDDDNVLHLASEEDIEEAMDDEREANNALFKSMCKEAIDDKESLPFLLWPAEGSLLVPWNTTRASLLYALEKCKHFILHSEEQTDGSE